MSDTCLSKDVLKRTIYEDIHIHALSYGKDAIGKSPDGKTLFIEGGAPGDIVSVEIVKDKKRYAHARILDIQSPSPERIKPACPYAGICGGCSWMHLSYEAQLKAKHVNTIAALSKLAHLPQDEAERLVKAPLPSKRELGYRNKIELAAKMGAGGLEIGFHSPNSDSLVGVPSCLLAHKAIQHAPKALKGSLSYLAHTQDLGMFRIGIRHSLRTREAEVCLWTEPGAFPRAIVAKTIQQALKPLKLTSIVRVLAHPGSERKVKGVEVLAGKGNWTEELNAKRFMISGPSFFQVNTTQAERMIDCVCEGLELNDGSVVADLYAGAGTFSLSLADYTEDVLAVECQASSVRDLRRNAEANGVWIDVIGGDAAREIEALKDLDALVVDPPRAGLDVSMPHSLALANPKRLAYVSCDPQTWARDVERLRAVGFQLRSVQPIDLFPQTYHSELVSIFTRA